MGRQTREEDGWVDQGRQVGEEDGDIVGGSGNLYLNKSYGRLMKAPTVVPQIFNICSCMAWILDTMTLDLSDTGLWW